MLEAFDDLSAANQSQRADLDAAFGLALALLDRGVPIRQTVEPANHTPYGLGRHRKLLG
jgi:hypothetical protein